MNNKLCIIDTETGGLDPMLHSILSLGAVIWEDRRIIDEFEVFIKEYTITVTPEAINVNKMNITTLCVEGTAVHDAVDHFRAFTLKHFPKEKVMLGGQNVNFDIGFLKRLWGFGIGAAMYDDVFSHRTIDTCSVLRFLMLSGRIDLENAGLTEACKYFGVTIPEGHRHTALGDAKATALLLSEMMDLVDGRGVEL